VVQVVNQSTDEQWQAGMAKVNITPPLGTWMMGFGARTHGAVGIYDHLYATAMVLSNSVTKIAVVSCDLLALDFEHVKDIRTQVADLTDIPAKHVMVHTTHTHAGPL
jgi:hypothetical protein